MPWAVALGAASGIGSYFANKSANDRANAISDEMMQKWLQLHIPDPVEQRLALEKFVTTGELTPAFEQAVAQDPSQFEQIVTNSEHSAAQNRALGELSKIGYDGGLRLEDKVALNDARAGSINREKAERMGIGDQMARRGMSGSGFDVAARLASQQGSADRESRASLQIASDAQQRALQAIMGAGNLASQYRTQGFNEQGQKATAADAINKFNTQNLRDVNSANVGSSNAANAYNFQNKQDISNKNTNLGNAEQQYNKGLQQQYYNNQMAQLKGASGHADNLAQGERIGGQLLGNTISNLGGAAADYATMEEYFKKKK